jgi:general secretion pathway protein K
LLAMLAPQQVSLDGARRIISERPAAGWSSLTDFWRVPALAQLMLPLDVQMQPQLRTRWFALDLRIELPGAQLVETALIDARIAPARVAVRRWGSDG